MSKETEDQINRRLEPTVFPAWPSHERLDPTHYSHENGGYRRGNATKDRARCLECVHHWDQLHDEAGQEGCVGCQMGVKHRMAYPSPIPKVTDTLEAMADKPKLGRWHDGVLSGEYGQDVAYRHPK